LLCHRAKGIHDGKAIGSERFHLLQEPQKSAVAVAHDIDGIDKKAVALFHDPPSEFQPFIHIVIVKGDPSGRHSAVVFLQLADIVAVVEGHEHIAGTGASLREDPFQFTHRAEEGPVLTVGAVPQEPGLYELCPGFLKPRHDIAYVLSLKIPVIDVAPVSDRKSTRLNSSHVSISYAVFCLKKKTK